jgi:hypothetical protein
MPRQTATTGPLGAAVGIPAPYPWGSAYRPGIHHPATGEPIALGPGEQLQRIAWPGAPVPPLPSASAASCASASPPPRPIQPHRLILKAL